jgi:hypothetical protein
MCLAVADAANGVVRDLGYPPPRSHPRRKTLAQDLRQTVRGVPEVGRALRAAVRLARQERRGVGRPRASAPVKRARPLWDPYVVVPSATACIDVGDWDDRAALLGGTTNALFAGFAALAAERVGRVGVDGAVTLSFPVSERTDGDARANALSSVEVKVDPSRATVDLTRIRSEVKLALWRHRQQPNDFLLLLPLTPLVPKRAATRLAEVAFAYDELPVGCSNVGALDPAVGRIDGSDADLVTVRLAEQGVRRSTLEQIGGQLFFACGRIAGKVFITAVGYQVGMENSKHRLRELLVETLKDFDLTGAVE